MHRHPQMMTRALNIAVRRRPGRLLNRRRTAVAIASVAMLAHGSPPPRHVRNLLAV